VFCPFEGCSRLRPYKMPGWLANHILTNHADLKYDEKSAECLVDRIFAEELVRSLASGELIERQHEQSHEDVEMELNQLNGIEDEPLEMTAVIQSSPVRSAHPIRSSHLHHPIANPSNTFPATLLFYDLETTG